MATKAKPNPLQEALRRATASYDQGGKEYQDYLLAGGGIREALSRAIAEVNPQVAQVRKEHGLAQERLGTVFANSQDELKGEADPFAREKIRALRSAQYTREAQGSGGTLKDLEADRAGQVDRFGNVFGAITSAKEFDVNQRKAALDRATGNVQRAEDRAYDSRFDDLKRKEMEASIAAANRSNRGGGGITPTQMLNDPLLELAARGVRRVAKADGGFDFFAPNGTPITVEQAASFTTFGTPAGLLAGSSSAQDQKRISDASGKPISAEASKVITAAQSGLQSLGTLRTLLDEKSSGYTRGLAKLPFALGDPKGQQYQNASRNASDVISRLRTGAAINKQEEALYKKYIPGPFDTPESATQKLDTLQFIFENLASGKRPSAQDLSTLTVVDTGV